MLRYGRLSQAAMGVIWASRVQALAVAITNTIPPAGHGPSAARPAMVLASLPTAAVSATPTLRKACRRRLSRNWGLFRRRCPVLLPEQTTPSFTPPRNEALVRAANRGT